MNNVGNIFFQFIFMLSAGSIAFLPLVQSKLTGVGHSKLILLISLFLSIIASLGLGLSFISFNYLSLSTFFHGIVLCLMYVRHKEDRGKEIYFYYLILNFCSVMFFWNLPLINSQKIFVLSCSLLLGLINYIMILGHYYLVVPKLTTKPLLIGIRIYWFLLICKLVLIFPFNFIFDFWQIFFRVLTNQGSFLSNSSLEISELALVFFQQISAYVANPILSYFAYKLCQLRSTQSATGIFYVMVFFALISEMLSLYLLYTKGIKI